MRNRRVFPWQDTMFTFWLSIAAIAVTVICLLTFAVPAYFWFILKVGGVL